MSYFHGVFVVVVTALIVTLLGQIPYQFINQEKLKGFGTKKKELKAKLKRPQIVDADDGVYENIQKEIIKINFHTSRYVIIPLVIQFAIIIFALDKLRVMDPMYLWLLWYIGFAMLFSRMWKKVFGMVLGV